MGTGAQLAARHSDQRAVAAGRHAAHTRWRLGLAVTALRTSTSGPVSTGMGDHVRVQVAVRDIYLGTVCDQPSRSTQPGYPFVDRRNEYQPKGGDALRLWSKGRYGSCVGAQPAEIKKKLKCC